MLRLPFFRSRLMVPVEYRVKLKNQTEICGVVLIPQNTVSGAQGSNLYKFVRNLLHVRKIVSQQILDDPQNHFYFVPGYLVQDGVILDSKEFQAG